jgi:hypothetical protein
MALSVQPDGMKLFQRIPSIDDAGYRRSPVVTIRWATPDDVRSLKILAALDEASVPPAPVLLAFAGDELWVAWSASTEAVISDPFRPSADVAALVRERGRQLTVAASAQARARLPRLRGRFSLPRLGREAS